jgi:hypothetical protein
LAEFIVPRFAIAAGPLPEGEAAALAQAELAQPRQLPDRRGGRGEAVRVAIGDAQGHLAPPAAQHAQMDFILGDRLAGRRGGRAPFIAQRLITEGGVAILRLLQPETVVGVLPQQPRVERAGAGQSFEAHPRLGREHTGIPRGMFLVQQFAKASGRGGAGWRVHVGRFSDG